MERSMQGQIVHPTSPTDIIFYKVRSARVQVMRTTRNIFIVNMAVSGVLLCSFTMPLTLVDLLYKYWALGTDQVQPALQVLGPGYRPGTA